MLQELGIDTTGSMLDPKEPPKAISFSIKTKETEAPARIEKKTAFLGESSEDEGMYVQIFVTLGTAF